MNTSNSVTRRRLLSGVPTAALLSITGCVGGGDSQDDVQDSDGDGVIDSQDYAPQDPDVQEKSDFQDTETTPEAPPETTTEAAPETTTPATRLADEAFTEYSAGVNDTDSGESEWGTGNDFINSDDFTGAKSAFQDAREGYAEAKRHFETTVELTVQLGNQDANEVASDALRTAEKNVTAANKVIDSMDAAIEYGVDSDEYDQAAREAREYVDETSNDGYEIGGVDEFRDTLNV
ncbi:hypothetical protein [Halopenitus persicus]|uniref:Uncharacterized protein n=1 Tax=Halopenitus persicus TaxID=1048396 RepID=A0A1H3HBZ0_9EURY|nr:hypothetical protein [Halopenitus persicus]SDY13001.1 hypothetical protein SAMN05216564_103213 [Halopenitus persicus]